MIEKDKITYFGLKNNENYASRLKQAYGYIKSEGINSYEEFKEREGLEIGAFTYDEITIFDRIADPKYLESLEVPVDENDPTVIAFKTNPNYGDELANWGTLGETPGRQELIDKGYISYGMTEEESKKHFGL